MRGEGERVYTYRVLAAATDAKGKYTVGPFYEDAEYTIEVTKDGYAFEPKEDDAAHFLARKLAQITVSVSELAAPPRPPLRPPPRSPPLLDPLLDPLLNPV
eukprot:7764888-Pyramimonas_sp.AAC.1